MSVRRLALHAGSEPAADFRERFTRLMGRAPPEAFKAYGFAQCSAGSWAFAGVTVEAGDRATAMATWLGKGIPARTPRTRLSLRVAPHGAVIDATGDTHSIVAPGHGRIEVAIHVPAAGRAHPNDGLAPLAVVVTVVWRESALRGLRYLASAGDVDGLVRNEIHRLCNPSGERMAPVAHPVA